MTTTLRARLTLWNIAIVSGAVLLFAILLYIWLARTLYSHHDQELADDANRLVQAAGSSASPLQVLAALDAAERVGPLLIVRDSSGRMLFRSARLSTTDPGIGEHTALTHAAMRGATTAQFFTIRLEQGNPVRFICVPMVRPAGAYLQLGRRLGDVDLLLRVVAIASLTLIPVVVLLTSFGGLLIAGRALKPIGVIGGALESIQATDLSLRVSTHTHDAEVTALTASINRLLDRLDRAFSSLRDFTADVSHQLQTPLTVMKGSIDVALSSERSAEAYKTALAEVAEDADALSSTLNDLRDYSLAEADSAGRSRTRVDLSAILQEGGELVRALAEAHEQSCDLDIPPAVFVWGNRIRLRQLLLNIGENAVQFTPPGGRISIRLREENNRAILILTDSGVGISPEALPHVFERRYRARASSSAGGTGLGLALVKRIVDAHGGTIAIESSPGRGTSVRVELPIADT